MAVLSILVNHGTQGVVIVAGRRRKGQTRLAVGHDAQLHTHRTNRIQAGGKCCGFCRVKRSQWLAAAVIAPEPAQPVGLATYRYRLRVGIDQEMRCLRPAFGGQARCAHKYQCLMLGLPLRAHEQVGKSGVGFVRTWGCQRHVKRRHEFDVQRFVTEITQLDLAKFNVILRADPYRHVGLQTRPGRVKTHPVSMVGAVVVGGRVGCRVLGDGNRRSRAIGPVRVWPTQIKKASMRVAQGIVAPTRDAHASPTAPARTVGTQCHAVTPVGQNVGRLNRRGTRCHIAQQSWCTAPHGLKQWPARRGLQD